MAQKRYVLMKVLICARPNVAVNHENDTCFENGLVMGYADCKYSAGLVETPKVVFKRPFVRHTANRYLCFPAFSKVT